MQLMIVWLFNRSQGSVPVVMLFHLTSNTVGIFEHALFTGADWPRNYILFVGLTTLLAIATVSLAGGRSRVTEENKGITEFQ